MKIALVTGGAKGIGKAISKELNKLGYKVVINYFSSKFEAENLAKEIKGVAIKCDVKNYEEVLKMFDEINKSLGKVELLVNNAGVCLKQNVISSVTEEEFNEVFNTNVKGAFNCSKRAVSDMLFLGYGKIINVSSIWGDVGASCEVVYSASKGAINAMTKALAKELAPSNITVNAVAPGFIETDMNKHLSKEEVELFCENIALSRVGKPQDVAKAVAYLVNADYVTGEILKVDGGF